MSLFLRFPSLRVFSIVTVKRLSKQKLSVLFFVVCLVSSFWFSWSENCGVELKMEQKSILISALSVGVGVGVGLGLASGSQTVNNWTGSGSASNAVTPDKMEKELLRQIVDGRESTVTFDQFPYYLRSPLPFLPSSFSRSTSIYNFYFSSLILIYLLKIKMIK